MTKKELAIYEKHGITVDGDYIVSPNGIRIKPMLKNNNSKVGKAVYTFSILPTNKEFNIDGIGVVRGTCPCHCDGCYGTKGCYNFKSVINGIGIITHLCYTELDFVHRALNAQLEIIGNADIRIHAVGDMFNDSYVEMWRTIALDHPNNRFWTYTKNGKYESMFDDIPNANIVKSVIDGCGFNFGHIGYIFDTYKTLVNNGATPYICRCGIDENQHCSNCDGCRVNKYVLFVEHSTEYKAVDDALYAKAVDIINMQDGKNHNAVVDAINA